MAGQPSGGDGSKSQVYVRSPGRRELQWLDAKSPLLEAVAGETVKCWDCLWVLRERAERDGYIALTLDPA